MKKNVIGKKCTYFLKAPASQLANLPCPSISTLSQTIPDFHGPKRAAF